MYPGMAMCGPHPSPASGSNSSASSGSMSVPSEGGNRFLLLQIFELRLSIRFVFSWSSHPQRLENAAVMRVRMAEVALEGLAVQGAVLEAAFLEDGHFQPGHGAHASGDDLTLQRVQARDVVAGQR